MDTFETRMQKKIHVFLYALLFLGTLLGLSVLLESCSKVVKSNEYAQTQATHSKVSVYSEIKINWL